MKLSVIFEDGTIVKDGIALTGVDLSGFDPNWRAVQWLDTKGWIETRVGDNLWLTDEASIQQFADLHTANLPVVAPPDPSAVPFVVTPYQARMALLNAGLLGQVDSLMAHPNTPQPAKIAWEYATEILRQSAFIETLGPAVGLTSEQIDDLFRAAAQIT